MAANPPPPDQEPMGLPRGTIRAIIVLFALAIWSGLAWFLVVSAVTGVDQKLLIFSALGEVATLGVGWYIGNRPTGQPPGG